MQAPVRGHVDLVSALSGSSLHLIACDIPSIVTPGAGGWADVPVWRFLVATGVGVRPLTGWHLTREPGVDAPIAGLPRITLEVLDCSLTPVRWPLSLNALVDHMDLLLEFEGADRCAHMEMVAFLHHPRRMRQPQQRAPGIDQ